VSAQMLVNALAVATEVRYRSARFGFGCGVGW
jgi:hypothetical protein